MSGNVVPLLSEECGMSGNYVFNCVDIAFLVSWKSPLLDSCISSNQQKRLAPGFTWAGAEAGSRVSGLTSREPDLREGQDI